MASMLNQRAPARGRAAPSTPAGDYDMQEPVRLAPPCSHSLVTKLLCRKQQSGCLQMTYPTESERPARGGSGGSVRAGALPA